VQEGRLRTAGGVVYPILRGVPRFVEQESYSGSFGYEWSRWPRVQFDSENEGGAQAGHTTQMWERIVLAPDEAIRGRGAGGVRLRTRAFSRRGATQGRHRGGDRHERGCGSRGPQFRGRPPMC
jgi:hypothetical protein